MQNIHALVVDERGRIFAWDSGDLKIRVFDAAGRALRLLGRRGQGPGELTQTGRMAVGSDTVWITEGASNRLTSFALNDKGTRTTYVSIGAMRPGSLRGKLKGGVWMNARPVGPSLGGYTHLFVSPAGVIQGTVLPFLPTRRELIYDLLQAGVRNGPLIGRVVTLQPFLAGAILEPSFDGSRFILAEAVTGAAGGSESMRLMAVGLKGDTIWNRTVSFTPTPITDADYQHYVDKLAAPEVHRGVTAAASRRMLTDSLMRPRNYPAFTRLIAGADGSIWLEHGSSSKNELFFWRFSPDGQYETCVTVPVGFRLMAATKNQLFGSRPDEDGFITIERYRVKQ